MSKLGLRLKELRIKNGYSQQQLADYLHLSRSTVEMYEHGKRDPNTETKEALADLFNVNMDYLFGRQDPDNADVAKAMELWAKYENLSPEKQAAFQNYLKFLLSEP